VAVRSPHLRQALRCFCLAAFGDLARRAGDGQELPFVLERHGGPSGPSLYEYRPLVARHVADQAARLRSLPDAAIALEELSREPAAAVFAAGCGRGPGALYQALLVPVLTRVAEACGGFDWDDAAFERVYAELEQTLFGAARRYRAVAPLVGVEIPAPVALSAAVRVRAARPTALDRRPPGAESLLPPGYGLAPERRAVIELDRELETGGRPADGSAELADAVTAIRLATGAPVAAGPVLYEQLDRLSLGARPLLGIAAAEPEGEPTRLDAFRGGLASRLLERLGDAETDSELAEALERWELSLFESEPWRSDRLREALEALLGGGDGLWAAAMRTIVLLGGSSGSTSLPSDLRALAHGGAATEFARSGVRRALVETLLGGDRQCLLAAADDALLGLRQRPPVASAVAAAS